MEDNRFKLILRDNQTGKEWMWMLTPNGSYSYHKINEYANQLGYGWRVPLYSEIINLFKCLKDSIQLKSFMQVLEGKVDTWYQSDKQTLTGSMLLVRHCGEVR